jgi:hypothetical protein
MQIHSPDVCVGVRVYMCPCMYMRRICVASCHMVTGLFDHASKEIFGIHVLRFNLYFI